MILDGKNILIMGIRNKWSIAYGVAKSAAAQGARVLFTYHPSENIEKINELMSEFKDSKGYALDVTNDDDIKEFFEKLKQDVDGLDGVLHSIAHANTEDLRNDFYKTSKEGFAHANDVSAYSFIAISRYAKELMNEGGSIVTLTYHGSTKVLPGYNVMGVAKAALEASVRYLASEFGKDEIRVNAVSAGPIKTLSARGIKDFGDMLSVVEERAPIHKGVTIEEVGDCVTFLFSKMSSSITGQVIYADHGYNIMGI